MRDLWQTSSDALYALKWRAMAKRDQSLLDDINVVIGQRWIAEQHQTRARREQIARFIRARAA